MPGVKIYDESGKQIQILMNSQDVVEFSQYINDNPYAQPDVLWQLGADIDMSGVTMEPIGEVKYAGDNDRWIDEKGFAGKFDGKNFTISNLTIKNENIYGGGFFGYLIGAEISNLHVKGNISGEREVGGFAGMAQNATITNCSFEGTVSALYYSSGGFIGTTGENTVIDRCSAIADVRGRYEVGGFAGAINNNAVVTNSFCEGTVSGYTLAQNETDLGFTHKDKIGTFPDGEPEIQMVGGFSGGTYNGTVKNVFSNSAVKAYNIAKMLGAFIGYHSGNDIESYYNSYLNQQWSIGYNYNKETNDFTAKGLNNDEMKIAKSFQGFDFENVWEIKDSSPYPTLKR